MTNAIYRVVAHGVEVRNAHHAKGRAVKEIRSKGTDILDETKKTVTFLLKRTLRIAQHTRAQILVLRIVQHLLALQVTNKDAKRARGGQVTPLTSRCNVF